jgi:hypothetical protein
MSSKRAGMRLEGLYTRGRGAAGPLARRIADMSRLTTIFRRRGGESGPGQETEGQPVAASGAGPAPDTPGFRDRGKLRRRLRYLRRVRDLQLRDLGGLVYETYRQSRPRQDIVERKIGVLAATDAELTGLATALDDRRSLLELREPGIGGLCPRCGELFGSDARFCAHCGAGLAGEAEAALGQFGAPAQQPGTAAQPALGAMPPQGAPSAPPPGTPPQQAPAPTPAPLAQPSTSSMPLLGGTQGSVPPPQPQAPAAAAPAQPATPPSGDQGMGSGDPLGQSAPSTPDTPEPPTAAMSSGDPLGMKPAQAASAENAAASAEAAAEHVAEEAKNEHGSFEPPASDDQTIVMRAGEENEHDESSRNGSDEHSAKARAARTSDESE